MSKRKNHHVVGLVCAMAIIPVIPPVMRIANVGIFLVRSVEAQTSTEWDDGASGPEWDEDDNWTFDAPTSSKDALHTTDASDILVNIANATCLTFTGDGGSPNDRFLIIDAGNELNVVGNAVSNSGRFAIKLEDGVSASDMTTLVVGGDVTRFSLIPMPVKLLLAEYLKIDITGDVTESIIDLGDDCRLDIGGDVSGIDGLESVTLGTSGGTGATVGNVGSVGEMVADETTAWNLRGESVLNVAGNYDGFATSHFPVFTMNDSSVATVGGTTTGAIWNLSDSSVFTGTGDIIRGSEEGAGIWTLRNDSRVIALDDIDGGVWNVHSDGGSSGIGVDVTDEFLPNTLTVSRGGTVECGDLGSLTGTPNNTPAWDMFFNGGDVVATTSAWFAGVQAGQTGFPTDANSKLTYTNTGNTLTADEVYVAGELINATGTSTLTLDIGRLFWPQPEIVRIVNDVTQIINWDTEGVSVEITEGVGEYLWEVTGPDYIYDDTGSDMGFNDSKVLFTDSACVRRWADVLFRDSTTTGAQMVLIDLYASTPMSGNSGSGVPGNLTEYLDALYTIDLTVEAGAVVNTDQSVVATIGPVLSIYYTGTCTLSGCGDCFDAGCATELAAAFDGRNPIKLTKVTTYGDFDGDKDSTGDADDETRFDAHFPSDVDDLGACGGAMQPDCYDPLVDSDCDGDVDCDDRAAMLANWPNSTLENAACD